MTPVQSRQPELALPVASLAALRAALAASVGADAAARALQDAGHAAGEAFFRALAYSPGQQEDGEATAREGLVQVGEDAFWRRFSQLFSTRGWGHLTHEAPHPGIGALDSTEWVEANIDSTATRPSCFFTTGLLANLLGRLADQEVAVLEVECRSRGDERCRFLFGGPEALDEVFRHIASGEDPARSLGALA